MLCCPFQMYHIHTKTHTQRHLFSLTTPLNKFLLTSEIAILVQGYSFSLLFHINSFSLQTFPPGSLWPSTLLNRKLFFSIANSVSLPLSLTFRCHPSTSSMPDCFDRPEIQVGGFDPSVERNSGSGVHSPTTGHRAPSHWLKSHGGF